ncbi:MAG: glucose-1-phosphate adenylyltransferase [Clostridia bacterium]
MKNKDCVAMILAGGQGSRLGTLTKDVAKPAVKFGAKYRIIDFTLTNCAHSGIDTVGVLTQYKPLILNTYISSGKSWDLDRLNGGVYVLPPYMQEDSGEWYKGTANAIYQNMSFIDQFNPKYVLVLSGDHIYKMDYSKMVKQHEATGADITIAYITVPIEEASRFGILSVDAEDRITAFDEKPKEPKSTSASMGIYVFNWSELKAQLIADEADKRSSNDFGKNIIPTMLKTDKKMYGYSFNGYWKDVGTIYSLWEAHMDMLDSNELKLYDEEWPIYSKSALKPPHFMDKHANVKNSFVTEGCYVDGTVVHSIISDGAKICEGSVIEDCVIMTDAVIGKGAKLKKVIVGQGAIIGENTVIGYNDADEYKSAYCGGGVSLISGGINIGKNRHIGKNCMVNCNLSDEQGGEN